MPQGCRLVRLFIGQVTAVSAGSLLLLAALLPVCDRAGLTEPVIRALGDREAWDRVLVFSRTTAFRHDAIPEAVEAIGALGAEHGFAVDATEDASVFVRSRFTLSPVAT